jgi:hypothetical protein
LSKTLIVLAVLAMAAMIATPAMAYTVLGSDNFNSYTVGNLGGQGSWVASGSHPDRITVAGDETNKYVQIVSGSSETGSVTWDIADFGDTTNGMAFGVKVKRYDPGGTLGGTQMSKLWINGTGHNVEWRPYQGAATNVATKGGIAGYVEDGTRSNIASPLSTTNWTDLLITINGGKAHFYVGGTELNVGGMAYSGTDITNLSFEVIANSTVVSTVYYDDMWYGSVPEPSSFMALGMFGLGALGFIKRRKA